MQMFLHSLSLYLSRNYANKMFTTLYVCSPVVNMSAAVGHGPYALGYQTAFDTGKSALTKHNLALNYAAGDMTLHTTSSDFKVRFINKTCAQQLL